MARSTPRPHPTMTHRRQPLIRHGPTCGATMWAAYDHDRTITTRVGVQRFTLHIRRCRTAACPPFQKPYRPEEAGRLALPTPACGLAIIPLVGTLRDAQHRSIPEMHQELGLRHVTMALRTGPHLLERDDELVALSLVDRRRLRQITQPQGRVILALDGLQPDVGHEVLWVLRDGLSGEVRLARRLLSATQKDLAALISAVKQALAVPIVGVMADGQHSIRRAVEQALPHVPHQRCHCHDLREAAKPLDEADRQAKKALKKRVRGGRLIERQLEGRPDPEAAVVLGYGSAVRRALTDDGRPPLDASGLTRHHRLTAIADRVDRVAKRGPCPTRSCD
jgi:hypothetical protein